MERLIYLLLAILGLFSLGCQRGHGNYKFPANNTISDPEGNPADSTVQFLPTKLVFKDTALVVEPRFWYTPNFHIAKEKILYNYYLDHDIYRFSWFRSFHGPVFISIHRELNKYWLAISKLNKPYVKYQHVIDFIPPKGTSEEDSKTFAARNKQMMDSLNIFPRIEVKKTIPIAKDEWDKFERLLNECDYWYLQPLIERQGLDGSRWIIEAHFENKYWFVDRWSPRDKFRRCGKYLLELSGIAEPIY